MSALTPAEALLAKQLVTVIDRASRFLISATPGTHYHGQCAEGLQQAVDEFVAANGRIQQRLEPIRPKHVEAAVTKFARQYRLGQLLYPTTTKGGEQT